MATSKSTLKLKFIRAFEAKRIRLGIREAATEALKEVIGPVRISKRVDGYLLICDQFETESSDNENDFLKAAIDLANSFKDKIVT